MLAQRSRKTHRHGNDTPITSVPQDLAGKRDRLLTSVHRLLSGETVGALPDISRAGILPANQEGFPQSIVVEIHLGTWLEHQMSFLFFGDPMSFQPTIQGLGKVSPSQAQCSGCF